MSPKSKNYAWQRNWVVDPEDSTAKHKNGVTFCFELQRDHSMRQRLVTNDETAAYLSSEFVSNMSEIDRSAHLTRLAKEARQVFFNRITCS